MIQNKNINNMKMIEGRWKMSDVKSDDESVHGNNRTVSLAYSGEELNYRSSKDISSPEGNTSGRMQPEPIMFGCWANARVDTLCD